MDWFLIFSKDKKLPTEKKICIFFNIFITESENNSIDKSITNQTEVNLHAK